MHGIDPGTLCSGPWWEPTHEDFERANPAPDVPYPSPDPAGRPAPDAEDRTIADEQLEPVFLDECDRILMTQGAFLAGRDFFASRTPEAAVLLLGPKNDALITHILIDDQGAATPVSFTLAAASLNRKVKPYLAAGLDIHGLWHLHPLGVTSLSYGDIEYARKLFLNPKHRALDRFVMPITASGRFYGFVLTRAGKDLCVRCAQLVLV